MLLLRQLEAAWTSMWIQLKEKKVVRVSSSWVNEQHFFLPLICTEYASVSDTILDFWFIIVSAIRQYSTENNKPKISDSLIKDSGDDAVLNNQGKCVYGTCTIELYGKLKDSLLRNA